MFKLSTSAVWVISHFDGLSVDARFASRSQVAESVIGGGLHAIDPLRSITNNMFAGRRSAVSARRLQLLASSASASSAGSDPSPALPAEPPVPAPPAPPPPPAPAPPLPAAAAPARGVP